MRAQLGDGELQRLIDAKAADDGNARVNADIHSDAPLYANAGGFERSVWIDPHRSSSGGCAASRAARGAPEIRVHRGATSEAPAEELPVAYEVAAVGARLANMARVGGQRVEEMDHFVESTETPIVRLVPPGAAVPDDGRSAVLAARKVAAPTTAAAAPAGLCTTRTVAHLLTATLKN